MPKIDQDGVRQAVESLLKALGQDLSDENLQGTPERVAKFWQEFFSPPPVREAFFSTEGQWVALGPIETYSLCAHHLLPIALKTYVVYRPMGKVIGVSKIARIVQEESAALILQEKFTRAIAVRMGEFSAGALVLVEGEHFCLRMRGPRSQALMTTMEVVGVVRRNPLFRREAFQLLTSLRGAHG